MAVFKPSNCSPFLTTVDTRIGESIKIKGTDIEINKVSPVLISMKVTTSNKNITGYKLHLLDSKNSLIFEGYEISPIEELNNITYKNKSKLGIPTNDNSINSGTNDTYLYIPFLQNINDKVLNSYNTLYFNNGQYFYYKNNQLELLDTDIVNNTNYTWYITLYQGNGEILNSTIDKLSKIYYNINDDSFNTWYDMILTTGTILGSCGQRIQISSKDGYLPNNNIVLQGKYITLGNYSVDGIFQPSSLTAYINNYDSSYGHIYPVKGSFADNIFEVTQNINACQFFENSTDTEQVYESNTVVVSSNINIPTVVTVVDEQPSAVQDGVLYLIKTEESTTFYYSHNNNVYSGLNFWSEYRENGQTLFVGGVVPNDGDRVLLKNQDNACLNGVYTFRSSESFDRSGGYTTWGNFIGSVLLSKTENKNYVSQATGGGSLYWKQGDGTISLDSASPLYFNEQQPIVLFDKKVSTYVTYINLERGEPSTSIDGYSPKEGDTCLSAGSLVIYSYNNNSWIKTEKTLNIGDIVGVKLGKQQGGKLYHIISSYIFVEDFSPCTALILKNDSEYLYISPFKNIKNDDKLVFNNSSIQSIIVDDINKELWRIKNNNGIILSSIDNIQYSIRSFYKDSDEYLFYTLDTPTISINVTNIDKTTRYLDSYKEETFIFYDEENQKDISTIIIGRYINNNRYISVDFSFDQNQSNSWNNVTWYIVNNMGYVVQSSDTMFGGLTQVNFYGLNNDNPDINQYNVVIDNNHTYKAKNYYYCVVIIEDNNGNVLSLGTRIDMQNELESSVNEKLGINNFSAKFNCEYNAVECDIDADSYILGTMPRELDGEIKVYNNIKNKNLIIGNNIDNPSPEYPIYYDNNTHNSYEAITGYDIKYVSQQDDPGIYVDTNNIIDFSVEDNNGSSSGKFISIAGGISLDCNYCGDIFETNINIDDNNILLLKLYLSDNFIDYVTEENGVAGSNGNNLNEDRGYCFFDININNQSNPFKAFKILNISDVLSKNQSWYDNGGKWYLDIVGEKALLAEERLHSFGPFPGNNKYKFIAFFDEVNKKYYTFTTSKFTGAIRPSGFLTNCAYPTTSRDDALTYISLWLDDYTSPLPQKYPEDFDSSQVDILWVRNEKGVWDDSLYWFDNEVKLETLDLEAHPRHSTDINDTYIGFQIDINNDELDNLSLWNDIKTEYSTTGQEEKIEFYRTIGDEKVILIILRMFQEL